MSNKKTIVIVEDHQLIREIWVLFLRQDERYELLLDSGDGQHAGEFIRQRKPELVMLDINMTPLSGFDLLKSTLTNGQGSPSGRICPAGNVFKRNWVSFKHRD